MIVYKMRTPYGTTPLWHIVASNGTQLATPCLVGCLNEVHPDVRRWHPGTVTAAAVASLFVAIVKNPALYMEQNGHNT